MFRLEDLVAKSEQVTASNRLLNPITDINIVSSTSGISMRRETATPGPYPLPAARGAGVRPRVSYQIAYPEH